jgi:hypothetical protein
LWAATTRSEVEIDRTDFEFTFQHRLNETFALIGGLRVEESVVDIATVSTMQRSDNSATLVNLLLGDPIDLDLAEPLALSGEGRGKSRVYSLRFGAAAYASLGENNVFFASGLLHVSHETGDGEVFTNTPGLPADAIQNPIADEDYIGPDLTIGFVRRIGERFDFDVRYRATAYFPDSDSDNPRVNHGPSLGFTFWFGG